MILRFASPPLNEYLQYTVNKPSGLAYTVADVPLPENEKLNDSKNEFEIGSMNIRRTQSTNQVKSLSTCCL